MWVNIEVLHRLCRKARCFLEKNYTAGTNFTHRSQQFCLWFYFFHKYHIFGSPNNFPQHHWPHSSIRMVTENASLTLADITTILAPALRYEYERNNAPAQEEEGGRVKNRLSKRDMIGMSGWVRGPLGACNLPMHPNQAGPDHIDSLAVITSPHLSARTQVWSVLY